MTLIAEDDISCDDVDDLYAESIVRSEEDELEITRAVTNGGGLPDPTFGVNGVVTIPFAEYQFVVSPFPLTFPDFYSEYFIPLVRGTVDAQRRSLLTITQNGMFVIVRLLDDGTLDQTFGPNANGKVFTFIPRSQEAYPVGFGDPKYAFASSQSITLDQQGKIVVGGFVVHDNLHTSNLLVARYDYDGNLDPFFGTNGLSEIQSDIGFSNFINQVIVDTQNRIVLVGSQNVQPAVGPIIRRFLVVRLLPDGSLDPAFANKGIFTCTVSAQSNAILRSIIVDPYGNYLIAGTAEYGKLGDVSSTDLMLIKLVENGSFDPTFGNNGIIKTKVTPKNGFYFNDIGGFKLILDAFQNVVVVGGGSDNLFGGFAKEDPIVLRYTAIQYALDNTFGVFGKSTIKSFEVANGFSSDVQIDLFENIVGTAYDGAFPGFYGLFRLLNNGVLDTTYGANGTGLVKVPAPFGYKFRPPFIQLDASGRLYTFTLLVHIFAFPQTASFYIARYTSDYNLLFQS